MKKLIKMKYLKHISLLSLTLSMMLCMINTIYAVNETITILNQELNISIDESTKIELLDNNDEVVATFYHLEGTGYIIIDNETQDFIEYSTESNNLFITDSSKTYYYGGPLQYFEEESENTLVEISSGISIDKSFASIERNNQTVTSPLQKTRTLLPGTYSSKLPYTPRTYDTNTSGNCGSTAAAILIAYYYDHINTVYATSNTVTSDGHALTNVFRPLIELSGGGSTYTSVTNGLNTYLGNRGLSRSAAKIALAPAADKIYSGHCPVIIGITGHPVYSEHWVVGYGFSISNLLVKSFTVNNGWGQNGIVINVSYIDGAICI